jgi:hypothetical protein
MPFPAGSYGLVPWMNGRIDAGVGGELSDATCVSFPFGGNVVFKWIEDGTFLNSEIAIWGHGRWGTDRQYNDHYAIARATTTLPSPPTYTVANRAALFAIVSPSYDSTAFVTSDSSYWNYYGLGWIRIVQKVNAGTVAAYSVTATIYTITVPQSDIPEIDGMSIDTGGYYDLCWEKNGAHSKRYDATFNVLPAGYKIYDEIPDRTELNSRVAGEKALFEDEFITASQVEAGSGIAIKWRKTDGSLSGYATEAIKGGNLVLEASGVIYTQAAKANAGVYYEEQTAYIQFRDKSFIHPFPEDSRIPIEFDVFQDGSASVITGSAINNNLYALRKDLLNVVTYPMGAIGDQTVNFIQFADNADVTWTVTGSRTSIYTPEGLVEKKGITVTPVITFPTGYTGWNVTDADTPTPTVGFVSDNDTVTFDGTNGVAVQVSTLSATDHKVEINRPLQLKEDGANVGSSGTTTINFDSNSETSTAYPINFVVSDISAGERRVRAYAGTQTVNPSNEVWVKHWWLQNQYANVQPTFDTVNQFVVGGFGVNAGAISFSGNGFWDTEPAPDVFLGTGETVIEHSGIVNPPQTPPTFIPPVNGISNQDRFLFEPVEILKTGCYLVHTVIQGLSSVHADSCIKGAVPVNQHEMSLHYFVNRMGSPLMTYCLDHKSKLFPGTSYAEAFGAGYPGQFSAKWSLQGTAILYLEAGDKLFAQAAAICYSPTAFAAPNYGVRRTYSVNYITQHIELVSQKTLTTNLYPHNNPLKVIDFFDFTV